MAAKIIIVSSVKWKKMLYVLSCVDDLVVADSNNESKERLNKLLKESSNRTSEDNDPRHASKSRK